MGTVVAMRSALLRWRRRACATHWAGAPTVHQPLSPLRRPYLTGSALPLLLRMLQLGWCEWRRSVAFETQTHTLRQIAVRHWRHCLTRGAMPRWHTQARAWAAIRALRTVPLPLHALLEPTIAWKAQPERAAQAARLALGVALWRRHAEQRAAALPWIVQPTPQRRLSGRGLPRRRRLLARAVLQWAAHSASRRNGRVKLAFAAASARRRCCGRALWDWRMTTQRRSTWRMQREVARLSNIAFRATVASTQEGLAQGAAAVPAGIPHEGGACSPDAEFARGGGPTDCRFNLSPLGLGPPSGLPPNLRGVVSMMHAIDSLGPHDDLEAMGRLESVGFAIGGIGDAGRQGGPAAAAAARCASVRRAAVLAERAHGRPFVRMVLRAWQLLAHAQTAARWAAQREGASRALRWWRRRARLWRRGRRMAELAAALDLRAALRRWEQGTEVAARRANAVARMRGALELRAWLRQKVRQSHVRADCLAMRASATARVLFCSLRALAGIAGERRERLRVRGAAHQWQLHRLWQRLRHGAAGSSHRLNVAQALAAPACKALMELEARHRLNALWRWRAHAAAVGQTSPPAAAALYARRWRRQAAEALALWAGVASMWGLHFSRAARANAMQRMRLFRRLVSGARASALSIATSRRGVNLFVASRHRRGLLCFLDAAHQRAHVQRAASNSAARWRRYALRCVLRCWLRGTVQRLMRQRSFSHPAAQHWAQAQRRRSFALWLHMTRCWRVQTLARYARPPQGSHSKALRPDSPQAQAGEGTSGSGRRSRSGQGSRPGFRARFKPGSG